MRRIEIKMDLADVDPNGIFENQTLGSAGNFNLNGIGVVNSEWVSPDGFAKKIGFTSSGNISSVNFVISGYEDKNKIRITNKFSSNSSLLDLLIGRIVLNIGWCV